MNLKQKILSIALLLFITNTAFSQIKSHDPGLWIASFVNADVNSKLGISQEFHRRYSSDGLYQGLWRPGMYYQIDTTHQLAVGATWLTKYRLENTNDPDAQPSWNFWVQYARNGKFKSWKVNHRLRLEYNRGTILDTDGYTYEDGFNGLRVRYRILLKKPIKENWGIVFYDEFWADMNLDNSKVDFDRNWLYAGAYYKITKKLTLDIGVIHQLINQSDFTESFPVLALSMSYKL